MDKTRSQFVWKTMPKNVISNRPGVKPKHRNCDTLDQVWSLFFEDGIIKHIVTLVINVSVKDFLE